MNTDNPTVEDLQREVARLRQERDALAARLEEARRSAEATALEEALRASESRLREIIESSINLFYIHTADHVLTYVSPHTQAFFECEPEEALVSWTEFVTDHPINQIGFAITQRAIETGERQPPYELELIGKKKRKLWVEVREAPLVRDGKTVAITGSLTDITARKRMEEALRSQNEQLRELDRLKNSFVGSVSHELRTPLTSIRGYAEFLQDEIAGPLSETQARYVAAMLEAAERLGRIVDDLLDFARLESGALTLFPRESSLTQKVQESINSLIPQAHAAHLQLVADLPDAPVLLVADIDRLGQVLLNLVNNAIKFTAPGGRVEVTLREADDEIRLEVRDTGIGIPPDKQAQIFEKFFQVDPSNTRAKGGAGLGLAISRALVEAHQGRIELESVPEQGAAFRILLSRSALEALGRRAALVDEDDADAPH